MRGMAEMEEYGVTGTVIADKYELLGEIGRGSIGVVYRAKSQEGGDVAVKVLFGVSDDDVKLKRFEQGINSARLLNHPNIVSIQDSGFTADNRPFYVTAFVAGKLLSDELKEVKRMPVHRAVRIMVQVCDAIDHAHYYGVIHRNLKPANIILTQNPDGSETAHVLDFGLAKSFFQANKPNHKLTATGEIVGSPEYMSPEQCMFKEVDWRSDIYAAACLLYHMLAGKPPFKGSSALDTLMRQVKDSPIDLIAAAPDALIPNAVRDVVMRALEKDPNHRQQTMILLRDDLVEAASQPAEPSAQEAPVVLDEKQEALRKAAEAGDKDAQFELASYLEKLPTTQNIAEIADWFRKAAEQGHADAAYRVGQAYELGLGVRRDMQKSIHYYQIAAAGGRTDAQLRWLHMAANEGDIDAQVTLAVMYKLGTSLPQNLAETERWLQKAAQMRFAISDESSSAGFSGVNGRMEHVIEFAHTLANRDHPEGNYWLGIIYKDGTGTQVDELRSAKWLIKAADLGHPLAEGELATLPPHVVDEARRGRPKWDHRKTNLPFNLSPESTQLIAACRELKQAETLQNRYELYEAMRRATLFVPYEDQALTRLAAVEDNDGHAAAVGFSDFATFNKWQSAINKNYAWKEKVGRDFCLELKQISNDISLVLDPTDKPGVTLRSWEIRELGANAHPIDRGVERGAFLTRLDVEPGVTAHSRVPQRPAQEFFEAVKMIVAGYKWVTAAFLVEAVFEPVRKPAEMTIILHTTGPNVPLKEANPVSDALCELMAEMLRAKHTRVVLAADGAPVLIDVRRASVCLYQRLKK
jgi:TPR repeat protein